jgi:hypothetical protein
MIFSITGQTSKLITDGSTTKIAAASTLPQEYGHGYARPEKFPTRMVTYKAVATTGDKDVRATLDQNPNTTGFQQRVWYFTVRGAIRSQQGSAAVARDRGLWAPALPLPVVIRQTVW